MVLLRHDVLIVESIINLDLLLGREMLFVCLPLALRSASGSPVGFALEWYPIKLTAHIHPYTLVGDTIRICYGDHEELVARGES